MEKPTTEDAIGDGDNTSSSAANNDNDGSRNDQVKHETLEEIQKNLVEKIQALMSGVEQTTDSTPPSTDDGPLVPMSKSQTKNSRGHDWTKDQIGGTSYTHLYYMQNTDRLAKPLEVAVRNGLGRAVKYVAQHVANIPIPGKDLPLSVHLRTQPCL
ncbi:hypothetical protein S7711_10844 [Stachybotrys chartarum IBT 7711]|uniref:Uncharacterized protein n=1 Tax=Stachybotrys chartarum (strain CBS 109288 / IBT 7711) TaxID=1280523 RepID=A0A084B5M2_STACB|nr:hypothetical protein S7711_10844 [Stachybotrys chartarum IBT 7711]